MKTPIVCGVASGKLIDLANPKLEDIEIKDIAWSLAHMLRFNGHLAYQISVAQHSIYVSQLAPSHLRLAALLHDAHETYLGDIVRPVKSYLRSEGVNVDELEDAWQNLIWERFDCIPKSAEDEQIIVEADDAQLAQEIHHYAPDGPFQEFARPFIKNMAFAPLTPQVVNPSRDYEAFMSRFSMLFPVDFAAKIL